MNLRGLGQQYGANHNKSSVSQSMGEKLVLEVVTGEEIPQLEGVPRSGLYKHF
jgi:hypothetical protein